MRLNFLEIQNVLSYGPVEQIKFDGKLTGLVGPNGAGKTNILRILTLVRDVIRRETMAPNSSEWNAMNGKTESMCPAHVSSSSPSQIKLGVTLTTDSYPLEQSPDSYLLHLFLRGIMASAQADIPRSSNDFVTANVSNTDTLDEIYAALKTGTIVLTHIRTMNATWTLAYEFTNDNQAYRWTLSHSPYGPFRGTLSVAGHATSGQPEEYKDRVSVSEGDDSSKVVNYGSMFPSEERSIYLKLSQQLPAFDSGSVWDELRRADLVPEASIMAGREPGLERVLVKVVADKIITDLDDLKLGAPATTNMEILASPHAPAEDIGQPTIPLYLSMLYRWSVGNSADRVRYSRAQVIFGELWGGNAIPELQVTAFRNIHPVSVDYVVDNLTPENGRPIKEYRQVQDYMLTIEPMVRVKGRPEIPLSATGSGGAELLRLATFLAVDETSVVLLDEPAAHLHPLKQEQLLQFLRDGNTQYVFVTHAPGLLPTWSEGLGATTRVSLDEKGFSKPHVLDKDVINKSDQLQRLVITQPEVRSIPFAESVIFVSGQTELIVYPRWLESIRTSTSGPFPHFVNFNGDAQFPRYLRVAHVFGIRWAVIADGKSFVPVSCLANLNKPSKVASETQCIPMIAKQVLEVVGEDPAYSQLRDAVNRPRLLLTEKPDEWLATWREELQNFGIFTLSNCWHNEKTPSVNCEQCGRSVKLDKDKCENSESHPGSSHQESFEDAVKDDSEPLEIAGKSKTKNVFELLSSNPDPSPKFEEFLKKVDNWFNPKA